MRPASFYFLFTFHLQTSQRNNEYRQVKLSAVSNFSRSADLQRGYIIFGRAFVKGYQIFTFQPRGG
jgi:CHASE3 domain sensor protein